MRQGTQPVTPYEPQDTMVIYDDGTYRYMCFAKPGTAVNLARWKVMRTQTDVSVLWADGNTYYDNLATNLATVQGLSYS